MQKTAEAQDIRLGLHLMRESGNIAEDKVAIERDIRQERRQLASIQRKKAEYEEEIKRLTSASAALKKLLASFEKERSKDLPAGGTGFGKVVTWQPSRNVIGTIIKSKSTNLDNI